MATTTTNPKSSNGHTSAIYEESALPPHNEEAEAALLGSVLIDPTRFPELDLEPIMFFRSSHRHVYSAFVSLQERKQPIDFITVSNYLESKEIDINYELVGLLTIVPTSIHMPAYAKIVRDMYNRRRLISYAGKLATNAYDMEEDLDATIAQAMDNVRTVGGDASTGEPVSSYDACNALIDTLTSRRENPKSIDDTMLSTSIVDLDRLLLGVEPGSLVICAARPGMGKSIFEQTVRMNVAKSGKRVAAFNLEMSNEQLMIRAASSMLKVPYSKISHPSQFTSQQWEQLLKAIGKMSAHNMYIDDTPSLSISQAESKMHRLVATHGHFDLVTFDYLQLMTGDDSARSRVQEIGQISRGLKRLARELDTVVFATAQINRGVESRVDKHPNLGDLRESGDIEQDADVVMFIYRDEYYNPETERANIAEIDVAKHRNGALGQVDLYFNGAMMMFRNLTRAAIDF